MTFCKGRGVCIYLQGIQGTPPWKVSADLHIGVNFCVWILQRDGLAVPPFDRPSSGIYPTTHIMMVPLALLLLIRKRQQPALGTLM